MLSALKRKAIAAIVSSSEPSKELDFNGWMISRFKDIKDLGLVEFRELDARFKQIISESERLTAAKNILIYFAQYNEKASYLCGSEFYLSQYQHSIAVRLAYIAGCYVLGRSTLTLAIADKLATDWQCPFTQIIHARVREDALGPQAEYETLQKAIALYPNDVLLKYNLIENLIGTDRVEEANALTAQIRSDVEVGLADEIIIAKKNQSILEAAIQKGLYAPEGDDDIYSDEMCRNNWLSYYESYVSRKSRYHGDRMLLESFVNWIVANKNDVDTVLDFGAFCAQPLYEAAQILPHIQFIGTDRQKFLAEMNEAAYPLPNMSYDHGDIFDVLERVSKRPGRKAITHVRTTCTLYPKFVQELYKKCAELGFEHIYMIENAGFVRPQMKFMRFESMQEPAFVTKHRLHMHNYREFLDQAGYTVKSFNRLRSPGLWRGDHPVNYMGSQYEIHAVKK